MKHIVFYSGGIGSRMTAKIIVVKHGKENVILLFTDTLIEDADLYRFIDETVKEMDVQYEYIADGRTPWEVFKDVKWLGNSRLAQCSHHLKQKTADRLIKENFEPDECILYLVIDWTEEHRKLKPVENWAPYQVEFPMWLIEPCVLAGSPLNGVVLDLFFGSGTTGLVSLKHERNFVGVEMNLEYIKIAEKRLSEVQLELIHEM
ncbi:DNA methyltransferase [Psychrobacillus sp. FSL K6-2836]|uniref:DNA methyltransferase n=1 Tax=Psychrobacillus sp. FSL K6-2836 TaxID=2921548 RepID=UPI0030FCBA9B